MTAPTHSIALTDAEIEQLTGYRQRCRQLQELHRLGFARAYRNRAGAVILERAHHDEVARCRLGNKPAQVAAPGVRTDFFTGGKGDQTKRAA